MASRLAFYLFLCLAAFCVASTALASDAYVLDPIVVTSSAAASGNVKKPPYAPGSVTVITGKELESRDVVSLADAVQGVEGVAIVGGRKSGSISIRGMDSGATLVLIDGRRLNSGFSDKANGMSEGLEANHIPPVSAIERIEIIRGPMSAVYGSDALGGVVNIITKKDLPKWVRSLGASATLMENGDSGNTYQADAYLSGPLWKDKLSARVWGFKKHHEEDDFEDGFYESDRQDISMALTFAPDEANEFFAHVEHIDQNMESTEGKSSDVSQSVYYDYDDQCVGHRGTYALFNSEIDLYRHKTERDGTNETWYPETENLVADAKITAPLQKHLATLGGQWKEDETRTAAGYKSTEGSYGRKSEMWERAIFVEDEWAVLEKLTLTAGLRYQDNEYYGDHWTSRLYGVYAIDEAWTIKGGYAGGYKNPTLRETDPNIGNPQSWRNPVAYTWGNPDLKPEESDNYEIALYYTPLSNFSFNATFFDTEYENKIINTGRTKFYDADGNPIVDSDGNIWGTYLNIGEATVRGLEFAFLYLPVPEVTIRGNYTHLDSKMDASDAVVYADNGDLIVDWRFLDGKPLVGTPENKAYLYGEWRIHRRFSVNATLNWQDGESNVNWSRTIAQESDYKMWDDELFTVDLGVSCRLTDFMTFYATVYNVGDEKRDTDADYTYLEEGRRYWFGLRADF